MKKIILAAAMAVFAAGCFSVGAAELPGKFEVDTFVGVFFPLRNDVEVTDVGDGTLILRTESFVREPFNAFFDYDRTVTRTLIDRESRAIREIASECYKAGELKDSYALVLHQDEGYGEFDDGTIIYFDGRYPVVDLYLQALYLGEQLGEVKEKDEFQFNLFNVAAKEFMTVKLVCAKKDRDKIRFNFYASSVKGLGGLVWERDRLTVELDKETGEFKQIKMGSIASRFKF